MRWIVFCVLLGAIGVVLAYTRAFARYSRSEMSYRGKLAWVVGAVFIGFSLFVIIAAAMGVKPMD